MGIPQSADVSEKRVPDRPHSLPARLAELTHPRAPLAPGLQQKRLNVRLLQQVGHKR